MSKFIKTAETEAEREKRYQHRGSVIGGPIGAAAMGLGNAFEGKSVGGMIGRGALGAMSGLVLGDKAGQSLGSLAHMIKSKKGLEVPEKKEAPKMENKIAEVLDSRSAVLFRSSQLHKIAAHLTGEEEVTLAGAVTKLAEKLYVQRAERKQITEGLAALESI
jgi:hypothetical protein